MPENRSRFVLLCQQSLAFALVAAVAAPAADMVTLDIVAPRRPRPSAAARRRGRPRAARPSAAATPRRWWPRRRSSPG